MDTTAKMKKRKDGKMYKAFDKLKKKLLGWNKKITLAKPKPRLSHSIDIKEMASPDGLDRISSLPKDVIGKILNNLTVREAVATVSLSTTWRYNWMYIPELVFNKRCALEGQTNAQLIKFLDNVLTCHDGGLTKFKIENYLDSPSLDMSRWLMILSRKRLNILYLQFFTSEMLPSSLFFCQDLKELVLSGCALPLPPRNECKGFNNLTSLSLVQVNADEETIEFLVNNSPFLRKLFLCVGLSTISHLNISAPNLESCAILGRFEDITFINAPKLKSASITTWLPASVANCRLDRVLEELVEIHSLHISYPLIEFLSVNNFWERLPITCHHLCNVTLNIDFEDPKQRLAALYLFRCAPSLITLIIIPQVPKQVFNKDSSLGRFYETQQGKKEAILQRLFSFYLIWFQGSVNELEFIQLVLLKANVLRILNVTWEADVQSSVVKEQVSVKLQQLQRSSSACKIIISS